MVLEIRRIMTFGEKETGGRGRGSSWDAGDVA
jgi:hypothetical protein